MQFVIIARDGTDPEAQARRQAVRSAHLEGIRPFVERGNILVGGAILNELGNMVGSVLMADFPTREELDAWLAGDPYVTDGVWQEVEVQPYRAAVVHGCLPARCFQGRGGSRSVDAIRWRHQRDPHRPS